MSLFDLPAPAPEPEPEPEQEPQPAGRCRRCHRKITDPVSLAYQIGEDCRERLGIPPPKTSPRIGVRWTGPVKDQIELEEINEGDQMTVKPPLPRPGDLGSFPRIRVDQSEGSPFAQVMQLAVIAADLWAVGPEGPWCKPQPQSDVTRGTLREAFLQLLELGIIDIDEERLAAGAVGGWPASRERESGEGR